MVIINLLAECVSFCNVLSIALCNYFIDSPYLLGSVTLVYFIPSFGHSCYFCRYDDCMLLWLVWLVCNSCIDTMQHKQWKV